MGHRLVGIFSLPLALVAQGDILKMECAAFAEWSKQSWTRAANAEPHPELGPAQLRRAANAYEAESKTPPIFTQPQVKAYETRQKAAYGTIAMALRLQADGWETRNAALTERGVQMDVAATDSIPLIAQDWADHCDR